jgi:hypothetical protein
MAPRDATLPELVSGRQVSADGKYSVRVSDDEQLFADGVRPTLGSVRGFLRGRCNDVVRRPGTYSREDTLMLLLEARWRLLTGRHHGWLDLDRALTTGEHREMIRAAPGWCAADRSASEVLGAFGPPSVLIGGSNRNCPKTFLYASGRRDQPCMSMHLWNRSVCSQAVRNMVSRCQSRNSPPGRSARLAGRSITWPALE